MKKYVSVMLAVMMLLTVLFTGCQSAATDEKTTVKTDPTDTVAVTKGGRLTIRVNPKISLDYDENGVVTNVEAENKDGELILAAVDEPVGMTASKAVEMLVTEIEAQGYFVDEIEDGKRLVMLQFKSGSIMPSDTFAQDVSGGAQQAVDALGAGNAVVTIGAQDYDASFTSGDYITREKAEEIALGYVGVTADSVVFEEREFDLDDGVAVYDLEFTIDGVKHEVDVDAVSGTVLKAKQKNDDREDEAVPEGDYITFEQAKQAALAHVGAAQQDAVFEVSDGLDREDGAVVYEVEFVVGDVEYEVEIDALTAQVVNVEQENDDEDKGDDDKRDKDRDDTVAEDPSFIGADEAKRIAVADAAADETVAQFDDIELDRKKGVTVYEVEFEVDGVEYEYHIDAVSGDILKSKQETDD